jgi:hypothetical protein
MSHSRRERAFGLGGPGNPPAAEFPQLDRQDGQCACGDIDERDQQARALGERQFGAGVRYRAAHTLSTIAQNYNALLNGKHRNES